MASARPRPADARRALSSIEEQIESLARERERLARALAKKVRAYERATPKKRGAAKLAENRQREENQREGRALRRRERKLEEARDRIREDLEALSAKRKAAKEKRERAAEERARREEAERQREKETRSKRLREEQKKAFESEEAKRQEEEKRAFVRAQRGEDRVYAEMVWIWLRSELPGLVRELKTRGIQSTDWTKLYRETAVVHGRLSVPYPQGRKLFLHLDQVIGSISTSTWYREIYFGARVTTEGNNKTESPGETSRTTPSGKVRSRYHSHFFRGLSATGLANGHAYLLNTVERMIRNIERVTKNPVVLIDILIRWSAATTRPRRPERRRRRRVS